MVSRGSAGGDDIYKFSINDTLTRFLFERIMVGAGGIEPPTSSVSRKRSTTEPRAYDTPETEMVLKGYEGVNAKGRRGARGERRRPP